MVNTQQQVAKISEMEETYIEKSKKRISERKRSHMVRLDGN